MNSGHAVRFGHSDSERLLFSNFDLDPDTYTLEADLRVGRLTGAARIYGRISELDDLYSRFSE